MEELANKLMANSPNFMMYLGSNTTPPCKESTIHVLSDKPLLIPGCQFKILRENSLPTTSARALHTRIEKPLNERSVYKFNKSQVVQIPSLIGLVPQSFNKYLLAHGPGYMARLFFKYGPNGKGGRYGRWLTPDAH